MSLVVGGGGGLSGSHGKRESNQAQTNMKKNNDNHSFRIED